MLLHPADCCKMRHWKLSTIVESLPQMLKLRKLRIPWILLKQQLVLLQIKLVQLESPVKHCGQLAEYLKTLKTVVDDAEIKLSNL